MSEDHRQNCFTGYSELTWLSYFDLVCCMIIDPMHNLFLSLCLTLFRVVLMDSNQFLGIVKTLWYNQWIQNLALQKSTDRRAQEIDVIYRFLVTVHTSLTCVSMTLPELVQGPSLGWETALLRRWAYRWFPVSWWVQTCSHIYLANCCEFHSLSSQHLMAFWKIPIVWETYFTEATKDYNNAKKQFPKAQEVHNKKLTKWKAQQEKASASSTHTLKKWKIDAKPKPPKYPHLHLHSDEPINLLHLLTVLKIFCGSSIAKELLPYATTLLHNFLIEYWQVCGWISFSCLTSLLTSTWLLHDVLLSHCIEQDFQAHLSAPPLWLDDFKKLKVRY